MKHFSKIFLVFFCGLLTCHSFGQAAWSTKYAYYGKDGKLTYTPDEEGNVIPDFSNVGYQYGDVGIPDVPAVVEVSPVDGDDGASIQAAIESLYDKAPDANGFRGAVLLKAGTYQIAGQLKIEQSGIVLRGEGQDDNGTVLIATGTSDRTLLDIGKSASLNVDKGSKATITESFVPLGGKFVVVDDASAYSAGDAIAIYRPGTSNWISDLKMDQISSDGDGTPSQQWRASSYSFYFERLVTKVNGDTIFFRNPIVMALDQKYGGGYAYKSSFDRLGNIGVENICFKSEYASDTDEDHSWIAVQFDDVENGWARDLTSWYFAYACVSVERDARLISVLDCSCFEPKSLITGARRYSFYCVGQLNLFKGCQTTEGRHDYVTSSRVCGPNVFTQCKASREYADIGPHHRWAMGTLFDEIESDGEINVQDRDNMGSGHGWAGANQVFWNCKATSSICQSPWVSAKNCNFGFLGEKKPGYRNDRPDGVWVGHNKPGIFPQSLYEAQLDERLNGTRVFTGYSALEALNDSTFKMTFNLSLKQDEIIAENFDISGTAGAQEHSYTIEAAGDNSIVFTFKGLGVLPSLSTIIVTASNLHSTDGLTLTGIKSSMYTEPDKRPVVSGPGLTVNNESGSFAVAQSTKTGYVYLVRVGEPVSSVDDFELDIENAKGAKSQVVEPDVSVPIYTEGLNGGVYYMFAVDAEGRISEAGENLVVINETGPVTSVDITPQARFNLKVVDRNLIITPPSYNNYRVTIYDITGRRLCEKTSLMGDQHIPITNPNRVLLVKISTPETVQVQKITVIQDY